MGQHGGPRIPQTGLKSSFDFGNILSYKTGSTIKNIYSNDNMSLSGSPTISGILSLIVATFNGSTVFATTSTTGLSGAYPRTLMAWVKPSSVANSAVLSLGTDGSSTLFEMCIYGTKIAIVWGNIVGVLLTSNQGSTVMTTNKWYLMCATNAGGSSSKTYLNGVLESSASIYTPNTSNTALTVGTSGRAASIGKFSGDISQVKFYQRELSANEIKQIFESQRKRYGL
jgi:hypothetical protein